MGGFRTTFRTIPASVAQWIEQRFPKPQVVGSIPTGGTMFVEPLVVALGLVRARFTFATTEPERSSEIDLCVSFATNETTLAI